MRTQRLGNGGPEVSVVGLGCNNFGRRCDLEQTRAVVDAALDAGVTLFDTADVYGEGLSEEYLGQLLEGRRDQVVLATKFGAQMPDGPDAPRGSRTWIRWAVERSLRRLRTDTIDLYQYHHPDGETPLEETLGALNELVEEGKVRFVGHSNFSPEQAEQAERIAGEQGWARCVSAQNRYSFVHRDAEDELLPTCERLGVGMLPYFPLGSGLLTGKYTRGVEPSEGRLAERPEWLTDEAFDRVDALQAFADERGVSLLEVAVGGLLAMPAVVSVIAGATRPEQVRANVEAGAWQPSADDVAALTALR
ncbi:MAG TPA: aldo/keto reductase [Gaiellaceae bacterium]|nr:aldo/keto reductase [Gaiellaceae bacterium]